MQSKADRTKNWLWRYRKAKIDVLGLEAEYEALLVAQESAGAMRYDGGRSSARPSDLSDLMIARERVMDRLIKRRRDMSTACFEIIEAAGHLEGVERTVVILRYIHLRDGYRANSLPDIANMMGYSTSQIKRFHGSALEKIGNMIPNEPK